MTATTMAAEELEAHRDSVATYIERTYEPFLWQKLLPPGDCSRPTWREGVWLAWDRRGGAVGLVGASGGYCPPGAGYSATIDLELSATQFEFLADELTYNDRAAIAP